MRAGGQRGSNPVEKWGIEFCEFFWRHLASDSDRLFGDKSPFSGEQRTAMLSSEIRICQKCLVALVRNRSGGWLKVPHLTSRTRGLAQLSTLPTIALTRRTLPPDRPSGSLGIGLRSLFPARAAGGHPRRGRPGELAERLLPDRMLSPRCHAPQYRSLAQSPPKPQRGSPWSRSETAAAVAHRCGVQASRSSHSVSPSQWRSRLRAVGRRMRRSRPRPRRSALPRHVRP